MSAQFEITFGIFSAAIAAMVAMLFHKIPEWTRPDIFFSVTVLPAFRETPEAKKILRAYRAQVWLAAAFSAAAIVFGVNTSLTLFVALGELVLVAGSLAAFLAARKGVLPHAVPASGVRVASLAPRPAHLPGGLIGQAGPFAILFAIAIWLRAHWTAIPERFPVHWDLSGHANGWATRSARGVYGPLLIAGSVLAMLTLMAYGILTSSRRVAADTDGKHDFMHRMLTALLVIEYGMALLFAFVGALPLIGQPGIALTFGVTLVFVAGVFVLVASLRRNSSSIASRAPHVQSAAESYAEIHHLASASDHQPAGDGTPDGNWKWGVIYYNPDDAALFVEKRFGIGYTMNLGRPVAWIILAAMLVVPLAIAAIVVLK